MLEGRHCFKQLTVEENLKIDDGNVQQVAEATDPDDPNDASLDLAKTFLGELSMPSNLTKGTSNGICHSAVFGDFSSLYVLEWGAAELMVPNDIIKVEEIPVLGSGKTDYVSTRRLAIDRLVHHEGYTLKGARMAIAGAAAGRGDREADEADVGGLSHRARGQVARQ